METYTNIEIQENVNERDPYKVFNAMYEQFILKMIDFFPEYRKLIFYHELLKNIQKANYKFPAQLYLSSVGPHSKYVFEADDTYFMRDEGVTITKTRNRAVIEETLKKNWYNMTPERKKIVWFFIQRLLLVSSFIEENPEEWMDLENVEELTNDFKIIDALEKDGLIRKK